MLYRTTDSHGNASFAVTTLLAPPSNVTSISTALLSYQIAIDSPDVDQQPSYTLYDATQAASLVDFTAALGRGWFVTVPDYEGPLAAFGSGYQEGQATLDNIRAVLHVAKTHPHIGLSASNDVKYALWGYSGGSVASEWAAELQPAYAPELGFAGAALGGLVPNATTLFGQIDGTAYAGDLPAVMVGVTAEEPGARAILLSKLKTAGPYNATTFLSVLHQSVLANFATFAYHTLSDYFVDGGEDVFAPVMTRLLDAAQAGQHGTPGMPLFVYKAVADEFSPVGQTDDLVDGFCARGVEVLYERNSVGEHVSEYANGHSRALEYLSMVFDGTVGSVYENQSCIVRNVSVVDSTGPVI